MSIKLYEYLKSRWILFEYRWDMYNVLILLYKMETELGLWNWITREIQ